MIPTFSAIRTLALILPLVTATTQAGSIYKCKQADGSITYTSTACPSDTVNKEYKGESRGRHASQNSYEGYNSITSQLQQIDRVKVEKRQQRDMRRQRDAVAKARRSEQKRQQEAPREFKEAKRILDDLPYGSPGDRAKRESMIEHARVLQNIGGAKLGQPPVQYPEHTNQIEFGTGSATRNPIPSTSGGFFNPAAGGYISPEGEFCPSAAGGLACPSGFVPVN